MYKYTGAHWLWFRTGFLLGLDGREPNPERKEDANDPHGSELAFRHGFDAGKAQRRMYCGDPPPTK